MHLFIGQARLKAAASVEAAANQQAAAAAALTEKREKRKAEEAAAEAEKQRIEAAAAAAKEAAWRASPECKAQEAAAAAKAAEDFYNSPGQKLLRAQAAKKAAEDQAKKARLLKMHEKVKGNKEVQVELNTTFERDKKEREVAYLGGVATKIQSSIRGKLGRTKVGTMGVWGGGEGVHQIMVYGYNSTTYFILYLPMTQRMP